MNHLFYTPNFAKTGDVIPFFRKGSKTFEGYYLKNWNPDAPEDMVIHAWHHIVSENNRDYVETPTNIDGGTGSVIEHEGKYHMFYCTFDQNPQAQWARHAVSDDLIHWTDIPEDKFGPDGVIYRMSDWRDPHVIWNEEEGVWYMLLAARENTLTERNGCVALCVSKDLHHWEYRKPLYASRSCQGANECPDLFKIGDWYYLSYSNYCDGFCTYYRMSRSMSGPWIRPERDTFDGRNFYAAKIGYDGENHYVYGWNPSRGENNWGFDPGTDLGKDYQSYNWGGSIIVHKIIQHEDGTLGCAPVDAVEQAFSNREKMEHQVLDGDWKIGEEELSVDSPDGYSCLLLNPEKALAPICALSMKLKCSDHPTRFGLALQVDKSFAEGYYLMFEPRFHRIQYRSGLRMYEQGGQMFPYTVELERPIDIEENEELEVQVFIQDSIGLLYVNHDLAFSFRMYNEKEKSVGLFVEDGNMVASEIRYAEFNVSDYEESSQSDQINRIQEMEAILDQANAALDASPESSLLLQKMDRKIQKLIEYYESDLWKQDFQDDADGKLPKNLKRGVLSEDGVYDFLMRYREI